MKAGDYGVEDPFFWGILPIAPSTNGLYINKKDGGRAKSPGYIEWTRVAGQWMLPLRSGWKRHGFITSQTGVAICMTLPYIEAADLDNRWKATLDLLKSMQIIVDDKMKFVHALNTSWSEAIPQDLMKVSIANVEAFKR